MMKQFPRCGCFYQHRVPVTLLLMTLSGLPLSMVWAQSSDMPGNYADNLELIRSASPRNTNHDNSPWRDTPQDDLVIDNHLGPRSDYLSSGLDLDSPPFYSGKEHPGATPEGAFPDEGGGQFRVTCEFSHFAYDDPLVHPGKPGASHLHMFWGNTDVNAFSTYDTLINSGSSTCNGQELNRTGYWMPALFDSEGNVRIPMRAIVYYKGYNKALGRSQPYPPGAAIIAMQNLHTVPADEGGVEVEDAYQCSDQFRGARWPQSNVMPDCPGGDVFIRTIELHVKFPNCWNGEDPSDTSNWRTSLAGDWYYSDCQDWITTPNIEYIVQFQVQEGENTDGWFLASDVNRQTLEIDKVPGSSLHADWWGGWQNEINQQWLDNCTNYKVDGVGSGCGMGYLSDNGPDPDNPYPGPALQLRPQFDQPQNGAPKIAAATLYEQLCPGGKRMESSEDAAWCTPSDLASGGGLLGRYFDDTFYGVEVGRRFDGPVNIDLNRKIPAGSNISDADDVSIEWSGYLVPDTSEELELWTRSDDGVRLYLDGKLLIDNWTEHEAIIDSVRTTLEAGRAHAITVQYYQGKGLSRFQLGWRKPGDRRRLIPRKYLYGRYPY
ncbi:MAG: DUF1996 domain-containing protein [Granulosicoccus sp.]